MIQKYQYVKTFTYGWWALPTMEVGAILGAVLGFMSTRWCLRG